MRKRNAGIVFFLAALASVLTISGCNITNPIIDEWWPVEETYDPDYTFTHEAYVVSFLSGEGSYVDLISDVENKNPPNQQVLANTKIVVPGLVESNVSRFFKGWYIDKDNNKIGGDTVDEKWDFADPVTKDDVNAEGFMYLHAGWDSTGYKVQFDLNPPAEATAEEWTEAYFTYIPKEEFIAAGAKAAEPLQFGRKNKDYVFTGWYKSEAFADANDSSNLWNFANQVDQTAAENDGDSDDTVLTLYAGWKPVSVLTVYTVNFISGTAPVPSQYVEDGKQLIAPYVVFRDYYSFGGWYKDAACTDDWVFSGADPDKANSTNDDNDGASDKIINLYAKWFPRNPVDVIKDLSVVSINYILFAGGGKEFNGPHGAGSSTNLTQTEKNTNDTVIGDVRDVLEENPHFRVMVVGHANPVTNEDKANPMNPELWGLSHDRATSVREELESVLDLPPADTYYDYLNATPIIPRYEGGRMALRDPSLSRRVEIIIFEIITETVTP